MTNALQAQRINKNFIISVGSPVTKKKLNKTGKIRKSPTRRDTFLAHKRHCSVATTTKMVPAEIS